MENVVDDVPEKTVAVGQGMDTDCLMFRLEVKDGDFRINSGSNEVIMPLWAMPLSILTAMVQMFRHDLEVNKDYYEKHPDMVECIKKLGE